MPPHPGQSNPVRSFITQVGRSVALLEVGRISSVYATPPDSSVVSPSGDTHLGILLHQLGDPPFRRSHVGILVTAVRRQAVVAHGRLLRARLRRADQQMRRQPVTAGRGLKG